MNTRSGETTMPYIIFVCVILLTLFAWTAYGKGQEGGETPATQAEKATPVVTVDIMKSMSRADIAARLSALEREKAPVPKMGAMCYKMAVMPARIEYVCPICGEKTLYAEGQDVEVARTVEVTRRSFEKVNRLGKLAMNLDERNLCKKCRPDAKTRDLVLTIRYSDGSSNTVSAVSDGDFALLEAFLKGQDFMKTFNDGELPLKYDLPRLQKLLGVKPE
jgi:hypothetical protein